MKCKEFIERKSLLYKTKVEYGDFTINHVQGCSHGCKYPCYAMLMAKRFGKAQSYDEWCNPKIVINALELLEKEIPKYKEKINSVQLCFSTDPFMYNYDDICDLSIKIIKKLNLAKIKCTALTKGVLPIELGGLSKENEYGITLISLNEEFRKSMEPGSAPYKDRIQSLKSLSKLGYKTWVSIEPYPTPNIINQNFDEILAAVNFVDRIVFGRLNYNPLVSSYKNHVAFFNDLSEKVMNFCIQNNIDYHIKEGTIRNLLNV